MPVLLPFYVSTLHQHRHFAGLWIPQIFKLNRNNFIRDLLSHGSARMKMQSFTSSLCLVRNQIAKSLIIMINKMIKLRSDYKSGRALALCPCPWEYTRDMEGSTESGMPFRVHGHWAKDSKKTTFTLKILSIPAIFSYLWFWFLAGEHADLRLPETNKYVSE